MNPAVLWKNKNSDGVKVKDLGPMSVAINMGGGIFLSASF